MPWSSRRTRNLVEKLSALECWKAWWMVEWWWKMLVKNVVFLLKVVCFRDFSPKIKMRVGFNGCFLTFVWLNGWIMLWLFKRKRGNPKNYYWGFFLFIIQRLLGASGHLMIPGCLMKGFFLWFIIPNWVGRQYPKQPGALFMANAGGKGFPDVPFLGWFGEHISGADVFFDAKKRVRWWIVLCRD